MADTLKVSRLFTDSNGDSRFGIYEVALELHAHAPPAAPFFTAVPKQAASYMFFRLPAGWFGDQHTTPNNRLVVCLAGSVKFIGSTGETLTLSPGDRMMDMNMTGKGHATQLVSDEPAEGIIIRTD